MSQRIVSSRTERPLPGLLVAKASPDHQLRTRVGGRTAVGRCASRSFWGRSISGVQGADLSRRRSAASSGLARRAAEVDKALLRLQLRRGHCNRRSCHRDRKHVSLDRCCSHRDLVRRWLRLDLGQYPARRSAGRIAPTRLGVALLSVAEGAPKRPRALQRSERPAHLRSAYACEMSDRLYALAVRFDAWMRMPHRVWDFLMSLPIPPGK